MKLYKLRLTMESDWRIGSGIGRQGAIDGLVARDVHGLPYVPSTTLRGIWRDAAEQLAHGLDGGASDFYGRLVQALFGSQPSIDEERGFETGPVPAALTVNDARFPDALGVHLKTKRAARAAFCLVKSGVAIDPQSGCAKDDFLRFDEIARAGALLDATAVIDLAGEPEVVEFGQALALAALKLVERVGGDRRRGAGRCSVEVVNEGKPSQIDEAVAWLARAVEEHAHERHKDWMPRRRPATKVSAYDSAGGHDGAHRLCLEVLLTAPTTIVERTEGNVISTLDHVPGTMLIPAAAALLGVAPDDERFARALGAGRLRVRAAYPGRVGERAVPIPIVFEQQKEPDPEHPGPSEPSDEIPSPRRPPGQVRNRLHEGKPKTDEQYKPLRSGYCLVRLGDGLLLAKTPRPKLRTHNAVDDQRQKPTEDVGGGVYVAEVLEPGTYLYAELLVDASLVGPGRLFATDQALAKLADKHNPKSVATRLGRGRAAGFGGAVVTVTAHHPPAPPATRDDAETAQDLLLLLASDLVLPADAGASPIEVLQEMLAEAGIHGTISKDLASRMRSDLRFRRIDGWVTNWGLPRPTLTAISAGSVIVIHNATASAAALQRLALDGLGMRRGEGFGEIVVNPSILLRGAELNPKQPLTRTKLVPVHTPYPRDHLHRFLKTVERAAVAEAVRVFAERAANDAALRRKELGWTAGDRPTPPMSQLGNIRAIVAAGSGKPDFDAAVSYLEQTAKVERRASSWGGEAIEKLRALLRRPEGIWSILRSVDEDAFDRFLSQSLIVTADVAAAQREIAEDALLDFLFAAMRQHKRASERAA